MVNSPTNDLKMSFFSETLENACDSYATCKNTDGTYTCECVDGFYASGKTCLNIDECQGHEHECHINAQERFYLSCLFDLEISTPLPSYWPMKAQLLR